MDPISPSHRKTHAAPSYLHALAFLSVRDARPTHAALRNPRVGRGSFATRLNEVKIISEGNSEQGERFTESVRQPDNQKAAWRPHDSDHHAPN